ncbi:MAG: SH3 domain-containing protein [Myxococcaceae bacterium]
MLRRGAGALVALGLMTGSAVAAVRVGGTLFVKARNTKLLASPSPTANVVALLQPGETVVWSGADPANKQFHRVTFGGKKGVIFQSNLSTTPPSKELVASQGGKELDPKAFASSGAATKALGETAKEYGEKNQDLKAAVGKLQSLEKLARSVTPAEISDHAKKAGIFPVVGGGK